MAFSFLCSSSKNLRVPFLFALWRAGGRGVENDWRCLIFMPHNMGLCGMDGQGGEGDGIHFDLSGGGRWCVLEKL